MIIRYLKASKITTVAKSSHRNGWLPYLMPTASYPYMLELSFCYQRENRKNLFYFKLPKNQKEKRLCHVFFHAYNIIFPHFLCAFQIFLLTLYPGIQFAHDGSVSHDGGLLLMGRWVSLFGERAGNRPRERPCAAPPDASGARGVTASDILE